MPSLRSICSGTLLLLAGAACRHRDARSASMHWDSTEPGLAIDGARAPDSLARLVAGCQGGVTGGGGGVTLTGAGRLVHWRRGSPEPTAADSAVARTDTAFARRMFARADSIGFRHINYDEPGNMSCFLELAEPAGTHRVTWAIGDERAPRAVLALFDTLSSGGEHAP